MIAYTILMELIIIILGINQIETLVRRGWLDCLINKKELKRQVFEWVNVERRIKKWAAELDFLVGVGLIKQKVNLFKLPWYLYFADNLLKQLSSYVLYPILNQFIFGSSFDCSLGPIMKRRCCASRYDFVWDWLSLDASKFKLNTINKPKVPLQLLAFILVGGSGLK